jgi:hypothetical protein
MELSNNELLNVTGGGIGKWIIIGGIIVFVIGFIDGYLNPAHKRR